MSGTVMGWSLAGWLFGAAERHFPRATRDDTNPASTRAQSHPSLTSPEHVRDATLFARIRANDTTALAKLMTVHVPALALFAERITRSRETAAEVVQDVFIRIWEQRHTLEITGSVAGYLWRATRNMALNARRHDRVVSRAASTAHALDATPNAIVYNTGSATVDAESALHDLREAVRELPPRCAEIFMLRWEHGLPAEEIATLLGLSLSTVRSQLSRAVRHVELRLRESQT